MGNALTFSAATDTIVVGWGFSTTAPTNPSSADSATFVYHEAGFGAFGLALNEAGSADYATWAAMATASSGSGNSTTTPATGGSNSTCTTTTNVANSTYDYIVAGAGPAGIIAAQRLAETGKSVLLIERGQASTYATGGRSTVAWNDTVTQYDVPSMAYYLTTASDTTEYCTDTANMAGCLLGGGTMVNALMFVPPQDADFNDKWPTGWKWGEVGASAARLYERNPGTTLASEDQQRYDQSVSHLGSILVFTANKHRLSLSFRHFSRPWDGLKLMPSRSQTVRRQSTATLHGISRMVCVLDQSSHTCHSLRPFQTSN